ncbi:MAG TPA: UDP-N-acetylmuramoyl-tripeptide--D-alanyl-D-alanine ligase [Actinomycetota bacterium]
MRPRTLSSVAELTRGRLAGADATVRGATADSRDVRPGELFVALRGERTDGHRFVDAAFEAGAAGALVEAEGEYAGPVVVTPESARGLLELAADEREARDAHVVAITGSTGKTSVKDLTAAVLASRHRVHASPRSFNTEVGVPVTLLRAPEDAEAIVLEMGARGRGHIALLAGVARPEVGIVTNVGAAHLEMFGSRDAVAEAKAELVEHLEPDGAAVLNADDPVVRGFGDRTAARVLLYGQDPDADVRGEDLRLDEQGRASFTLRTPEGSERVELSIVGEHMASNALAAAAAGAALGLSPGECAAALKDARLSAWRMEVAETPHGVRVLNDAYNANPSSMAAGLKAAVWMSRGGRCIAVLGWMAELGASSDEEHERVGELVARLGVDHLVTVGEHAARIAVGAAREGVEPGRITEVRDADEAAAEVLRIAEAGDLVFLKGSRVVGLERVASLLMEGGA